MEVGEGVNVASGVEVAVRVGSGVIVGNAVAVLVAEGVGEGGRIWLAMGFPNSADAPLAISAINATVSHCRP